MTERKDQVLIIGAGHNALACAAYLARAGRKVTVLEAAANVGGAAITHEFTPGFRVSAGAHLLYLLDPVVRKELQLEQHGLKLARDDLSTIALAADGKWLRVHGAKLDGPGALPADQAAMSEFHRFMSRFAGVVGGLHHQLPPRLGTTNRDDLLALAKLGWSIRRMGTADMREFLRITGINVFDVLQENFDSELLKGALSLDGTLGAFLGPRSNNSLFNALHRWSNGHRYSLPAGGMGAVAEAFAAAARAAGAELRTQAAVTRILVESGQVAGVELENGERLTAASVISGADPRTTFRELLGVRHVEAGFAHRVRNIRNQGHVAKLHLALSGLPAFTGLDPALAGERLLIAPSLQYVDHAFNHSKYGEFSTAPVLEISIPSVHDHSLAPAGQHVLSANVQWAPYALKGGWTPEARARFLEATLTVLEQHAPGLRKQVLHSELLTPVDLESRFRMAGGHWHHAELALDQFLMLRPVPGAARYHTPVDGLWLCGAGSHPGGGVMGSAGRNAAQAFLKGGKG